MATSWQDDLWCRGDISPLFTVVSFFFFSGLSHPSGLVLTLLVAENWHPMIFVHFICSCGTALISYRHVNTLNFQLKLSCWLASCTHRNGAVTKRSIVLFFPVILRDVYVHGSTKNISKRRSTSNAKPVCGGVATPRKQLKSTELNRKSWLGVATVSGAVSAIGVVATWRLTSDSVAEATV